jgi:hypothetical protein
MLCTARPQAAKRKTLHYITVSGCTSRMVKAAAQAAREKPQNKKASHCTIVSGSTSRKMKITSGSASRMVKTAK